MASPPGASTRETGREFPGHRSAPGVPPTVTAIGDAIQDGGAPPPRSRPVAGPHAPGLSSGSLPTKAYHRGLAPEDAMAETVTWPDGARCAVMMTFDLDG